MTPDAVTSYRRDGDGRLTDIDRDKDGDGTDDVNVHVVGNAAGIRIQSSSAPDDNTPLSSITCFNEAGDRPAAGCDSDADPDLVPDSFFYSPCSMSTSSYRPRRRQRRGCRRARAQAGRN